MEGSLDSNPRHMCLHTHTHGKSEEQSQGDPGADTGMCLLAPGSRGHLSLRPLRGLQFTLCCKSAQQRHLWDSNWLAFKVPGAGGKMAAQQAPGLFCSLSHLFLRLSNSGNLPHWLS